MAAGITKFTGSAEVYIREWKLIEYKMIYDFIVQNNLKFID